MDKAQLVKADLQTGREIVERLEALGIPIDVALWLQDDETGLWQLVISSPTVSKTGSKRVYEALISIIGDQGTGDVELGDIHVASPHETFIRDIKQRVGTNSALHEIRLDRLDLGSQRFRSARIYRVLGGEIDNGARVRVRATGEMGTVRGVIKTPTGPRYLVLYDSGKDDIRPLDSEHRPPVGQDYGAEELDFLYVVRTGGWPERIPQWLADATGVSSFTGTALASPPGQE